MINFNFNKNLFLGIFDIWIICVNHKRMFENYGIPLFKHPLIEEMIDDNDDYLLRQHNLIRTVALEHLKKSKNGK